MKTAINSTLAALVLASTVFGGASAAFAGGGYYEGVSATPIHQDSVVVRTGAAIIAPDVQNGGDGAYYAGLDRNPVDTVTTGSISNGQATQVTANGGEGDYFPGLNRN